MSSPWIWDQYPPWRGFYEAIVQGNTDHVKKCLQQNMDFRLYLTRKLNALDLAAVYGQVEVVKVILASSQFKSLPRREKAETVAECLGSCGEDSIEVFKYFLTLKESWIYPDLLTMIEKKVNILSFNLTPEHDDILEHILPFENGAEELKERLSAAFFGLWVGYVDRRIYRQEILCIMKKCNLSAKQVCEILDIEPLLLESCIGDVETVGKLLDDWFQSDSFDHWLQFTYQTRRRRRKISYDEFCAAKEMRCAADEKHKRPEVIAARSRRADLLALILDKLKSKLESIDDDRERIWKHTLWNLLEEHVGDVNVLRVLPDEAFDMDGQIPANSDSYDGLPWFFLGEGSITLDRPDSRLVRELLNFALESSHNHELFEFYVEKFKIHEAHICISSDLTWYEVPEDHLWEPAKDSTTSVNSLEDQIVEIGDVNAENVDADTPVIDPNKDYWDDLYGKREWDPLECLTTERMITRYGTMAEDELREIIYLCGDVRLLQCINHRTKILDSHAPHALVGPICNSIYCPDEVFDELTPLPVLEFITEYHSQSGPRDGESRSRDIRSNRFYIKQDGTIDMRWHLLTIHAREALKITLSKSLSAADSLENMVIKNCAAMFRSKREMRVHHYYFQHINEKLRKLAESGVQAGEDHEEAELKWREKMVRIVRGELDDEEAKAENDRIDEELTKLGDPYSGPPKLCASEREGLIYNCFSADLRYNFHTGSFHMAVLIAAMELYDLGKDFGPKMGEVVIYHEKEDAYDRRLFLRDIVLGLCGSLLFSLKFNDLLSFLVGDSIKMKTPKSFLVRQVCVLVANSGIVINDETFHTGTQQLLPVNSIEEMKNYARVTREDPLVTHVLLLVQRADKPYYEAMAQEHPEITVERRRLSLASLCRIIIHRYIKLSPGFLTDKVRSLNLPLVIEDFLLFHDIKGTWDNREFLEDLINKFGDNLNVDDIETG